MQDFVLTRKDTNESVRLPADMRWTDEYAWQAIAQAEPQRTLSGGLIIQQGMKRNGRPITLAGDWVWLDLGVVRTLRDWTDVPELEMRLQHYDGREFDVIFRLHDGALRNIEPIRFSVPENDRERYRAEIALMTI